MFKLPAKMIYNRISDTLVMSCNQSGFRSKQYLHCMLKYRSLNSNVSSCFLEASKAFDRVNHSNLFGTLLTRGVPL